MRPLMRLFVIGLLLCPPLLAADPVIVPMTGEVVVSAADNPQAALRRITRSERKLAREVIRDAANAAGMRRLEFMRAVDEGDVEANDELKLSLLQHPGARDIDIERFKEILAVILDFIKQLLALFAMFADNATLDAVDVWCVNVGFDLAERLAA